MKTTAYFFLLALLWSYRVSLCAAETSSKEIQLPVALQERLLRHSGALEAEIEKHKKVLQEVEAAYGPEHQKTAIALFELAEMYRIQGIDDEARPLYLRALDINKKTLDPDHPSIGIVLHRLGDMYKNREQWAEAETQYAQALEVLGKAFAPEHEWVEQCIRNLVEVSKEQQKFTQAHAYFQRLIDNKKAVLGADHPDVLEAQRELADLYLDQGAFTEAEQIFQRLYSLQKRNFGPNHPEVARGLHDLCELQRQQGQYEDAFRFCKQALSIVKRAGEEGKSRQSAVLNTLGSIYNLQGKYTESELNYSQSITIDEELLGKDAPGLWFSYNNLAGTYSAQGKWADAVALWEKTLRLYEEHTSALYPEERRQYFGVASALTSNLAAGYRSLGKPVEAERVALKTLELYKDRYGYDHPNIIPVLQTLGGVCKTRQQVADAETYYQRAVTSAERFFGLENPTTANALSNLASLYVWQEEFKEARALNEQVLTIREKMLGPEHPDVAATLANHAYIERALGRLPAALLLLQRALQIDDLTIKNVFSLASEQEKFTFLEQIDFRFHEMMSLVKEMAGDPEAVRVGLEVALQRKGAVLDALALERQILSEVEGPQVREIYHQLQKIISRISSLSITGQVSATYRKSLAELQVKKEELEENLSRLSGTYASWHQSDEITADRVAQAMRPGSALVEYVSYRIAPRSDLKSESFSRYLAFILPAGEKAEPMLVDLEGNMWPDVLVGGFRREINRFSSGKYSGEGLAEQNVKRAGKALYEKVFEPLQEALAGCTEIYLAPASKLNLIPFGALVDEEGRYLADTYQFYYLSSGRDLLRLAEESSSAHGAVVLADPNYDLNPAEQDAVRLALDDSPVLTTRGEGQRSVDMTEFEWSPLPGTRREGEIVAEKLADGQVQLYTGDRALEEVVKELSSPRILHLATHGFFLEEEGIEAESASGEEKRGLKKKDDTDISFGGRSAEKSMDENPLLRSGLVLAGANRLGQMSSETQSDDGILTALELSSVSLQGTNLVVLSACETGLGETRQGEGVFGLRRAFQLAGARTVVMSLWSIPDEETMLLMSDFYDRLQRGVPKARALQQASLALMQKRRTQHGAAHPYFWGAFICVGDPGKL